MAFSMNYEALFFVCCFVSRNTDGLLLYPDSFSLYISSRKLSPKDAVCMFAFPLYIFVCMWYVHPNVYMCVLVDTRNWHQESPWCLSNLFIKTRSSEGYRCGEMNRKPWVCPSWASCSPCSESTGAINVIGCHGLSTWLAVMSGDLNSSPH